MIERKYWAEGYCVEHSAQMFCGECSTPFPRSDSFVSYILFFKQKMQARFPSLVEHLPLREQDEPPWFVLDRTLNAKFEHWGSFRRTFSAITTLPMRSPQW